MGSKRSRPNKALFVDQFDPYMAIMLHERAADPAAFIGGGDAVHPGPAGHTIMAWAILKGLGAPALVSRAEIDGAAGKVLAAEGCRVTNLKADQGTVAFDRSDDALPMPVDPKAEPALKLAPILQDLDRYELQVTGLPAGTYELSIDGEPAGKASSEDLAKGWNLATSAGPITKQAQEVLALVFQKNNLYFQRWRTVQLYEFPTWAQSSEKRADVLRSWRDWTPRSPRPRPKLTLLASPSRIISTFGSSNGAPIGAASSHQYLRALLPIAIKCLFLLEQAAGEVERRPAGAVIRFRVVFEELHPEHSARAYSIAPGSVTMKLAS